jgi:hypothetical protein
MAENAATCTADGTGTGAQLRDGTGGLMMGGANGNGQRTGGMMGSGYRANGNSAGNAGNCPMLNDGDE